MKIAMSIVALLVVLMVMLARDEYHRQDARRAAAFRFVLDEPEAALKQITQVAQSKGSLAGSGVGVTISDKELTHLGPTQWAVSPDGEVRGTAPKHGLVVLLTPKMLYSKVMWNCKVEPERAFSASACDFLHKRTADNALQPAR